MGGESNKNSTDMCLNCKEICTTHSLCCSECDRWIHYICSELPIYYILILENTKRKYSCAYCAKNKICENYDKQYVQLDTELANEYQDREDRQNCKRQGEKIDLIVNKGETLTESILENKTQEDHHQSNTFLTRETEKSPLNKTKTSYLTDNNSHGKRKQNEQTNNKTFKPNNHNADRNRKICNYFKKGKCKYGLKGNGCSYAHPARCTKFIFDGNGQQGCNLGSKCEFLHPIICRSSWNWRECYNDNCGYSHLKGTIRSRPQTQRYIPPPPSQCSYPNSYQNHSTDNHLYNSVRIQNQTNADNIKPPKLTPPSTGQDDLRLGFQMLHTQVAEIKRCMNLILERQQEPQFSPNTNFLAHTSHKISNELGLHILYLNINGLYPSSNTSKISFLESLTDNSTLAISITEIHLNNFIKDSEIHINNFILYRVDRIGKSHGGVALYIRENLESEQLMAFSNGICEFQIVKLRVMGKIIYFINFYRPPSSSIDKFTEAVNEIFKCDEVVNTTDRILVTGDFNLPNCKFDNNGIIDSSHNSSNIGTLDELMARLGIYQCVRDGTRKNNILDLVFSNDGDIIDEIEIVPTILSDHKLLKITTDVTMICDTLPTVGRSLIPFSNLDIRKSKWPSVNEFLNEINWTEELKHLNVDECWKFIWETLNTALNTHTPLKSISDKAISREHRERKRLMKLRQKIINRITKFTTSERKERLNQQILDIENEIKESFIAENLCEERRAIDKIRKDSKYFYKFAKRKNVLKTKIGPLSDPEGNLTHEPHVMANLLQNQYKSVWSDPIELHEGCTPVLQTIEDFDFGVGDVSAAIECLKSNTSPGPDGIGPYILSCCVNSISLPLHILWRKSLDSGTVPDIFKNAHITPIYKSGSRRLPENYRPISLTSSVIKVFEKIVKDRLTGFLERHNLLQDFQHGFRLGRSCLTALIDYFNTIVELLLTNQNVDVVYLDFAKAFDRVDHGVLLEKMKRIGVSGKLYSWIESFLCNRKQVVIVDGVQSVPVTVKSGVPQGTVLGPLLFLIMINDISEGLVCRILSFADDTRLLKNVTSVSDCESLQNDLNKTFQYASRNNLAFNKSKFQVIKFGKLENLKDAYNYVGPSSDVIQRATEVKDLGVTFSDTLSFSSHINKVVFKCRQMSGYIFRTFSSRDPDTMLTLYKSLVQPHIDYCCQLWFPHRALELQKLESIQRLYTMRISDVKNLNYWERLSNLKLFSVERRIERYIIIYVWKVLECLILAPETESIVPYFSARQGRMCRRFNVSDGPHIFQTLQYNSLSRCGARLFNCLPRYLRDVSGTVSTFKEGLDKFLLSLPD